MKDSGKKFMRFYFLYVQPWQFLMRRKFRKTTFGIEDSIDMPKAAIDFQRDQTTCNHLCIGDTGRHQRYLSDYYVFEKQPEAKSMDLWGRGFPAIINLTTYKSADDYQQGLKRQSKGAHLRQIKKAKSYGYTCGRFNFEDYSDEILTIKQSKNFRSGGPVMAALFKKKPSSKARTEVPHEVTDPSCPNHWYLYWGVFLAKEDSEQNKTLAGYIKLNRVGNIVHIPGIMGHAKHLRTGALKCLFLETVSWLIESEEPAVQGTQYLQYGSIEHASKGLAQWKKNFLFEPYVFKSFK